MKDYRKLLGLDPDIPSRVVVRSLEERSTTEVDCLINDTCGQVKAVRGQISPDVPKIQVSPAVESGGDISGLFSPGYESKRFEDSVTQIPREDRLSPSVYDMYRKALIGFHELDEPSGEILYADPEVLEAMLRILNEVRGAHEWNGRSFVPVKSRS